MVEHHAGGAISKKERQSAGGRWPDWHPMLKPFRYSNRRKAAWQLANTLVPYACLWYLLIRSIQQGYPYIVTLMLALPTAAFLVRIPQHPANSRRKRAQSGYT